MTATSKSPSSSKRRRTRKRNTPSVLQVSPGRGREDRVCLPRWVVGTTLENCWRQAVANTKSGRALSQLRQQGSGRGIQSHCGDLRHDFHRRETARTEIPGLLENVQSGRVFKRDQPVKWRCLNCGYVHEGPEAPAACAALLIHRRISRYWWRVGEGPCATYEGCNSLLRSV